MKRDTSASKWGSWWLVLVKPQQGAWGSSGGFMPCKSSHRQPSRQANQRRTDDWSRWGPTHLFPPFCPLDCLGWARKVWQHQSLLSLPEKTSAKLVRDNLTSDHLCLLAPPPTCRKCPIIIITGNMRQAALTQPCLNHLGSVYLSLAHTEVWGDWVTRSAEWQGDSLLNLCMAEVAVDTTYGYDNWLTHYHHCYYCYYSYCYYHHYPSQ